MAFDEDDAITILGALGTAATACFVIAYKLFVAWAIYTVVTNGLKFHIDNPTCPQTPSVSTYSGGIAQ